MKVIVTGGNGFIGTNLLVELIDHGYDVVSFDQKEPIIKRVKWFRGDILDTQSLLEAFHDAACVVHLAAVSDVNKAVENPEACHRTNVEGTRNVLLAAGMNHIKQVLYASTVWVYNRTDALEVSEGSQLNDHTTDPYTDTKVLAEELCRKHNASVLRFGVPYGPYMRDNLLLSIFVRKALNNEPLTIAGDGTQSRNFIYVKDLTQGIRNCIEKEIQGQTINLDGNKAISINAIAAAISEMITDTQTTHIPKRGIDMVPKKVSIQKAKSLLAWEPVTDFEKGLKEYVRWYQSTR